ncbi:MAG: membrane protein insertase YidC [Christensenellales bacterium]|jgi:YidC/Oxa1 family membrane protein insertase|nr:YidC/Oxa1 family membrane protein insertase [Clostridiales bacterium]
MGSLFAASLNWIGKIIYNGLYSWVQTWATEQSWISYFAITVILFTIFLKLILLPLDVWQKVLTRKNQLKMEVMKPELNKIQEQYGSDREALMRSQRALYKKYKYKTFAACLPSIVTMVIFFIVLSGFTSSVKYHNVKMFEKLQETYNTTYTTTLEAERAANPEQGEADNIKKAVIEAEKAVIADYDPENFLLTKNIFMPDTWKPPVPNVYTYAGTGLGKIGITGVDRDEYNKVMGPIMDTYNINEKGKKQWNGYLVLPIISILLNFLSSILIKPPEQPAMAGQTAEQQKMQKSQAKMMQFMMPVMMGIFALLYSTAFTLYMTISAGLTLLLNLGFNFVFKMIDKKRASQGISVVIK